MKPTPDKSRFGVMAALAAAVAASACCTIPLVLVALGVGGAWAGTLTAFEPFRPWFIGIALTALAYAGIREWRVSRTSAAGVECDCEEEAVSPRTRRTLLVAGAALALLLIASPWLIRAVNPPMGAASLSAASASHATIVLDVEGMTCASCHVTVQQALLALDGVQSADVSFEAAQAVVTYDPGRVTVAELTRATANAGYPSHPAGT